MKTLLFIGIAILLVVGSLLAEDPWQRPLEDSTARAAAAAAQASADAAQATADAAIADGAASGTVTNLTVDKIFFTNGGTNSWLTFSSATNAILRINGSNTVFNIPLGQE